MSDTPLNEDGFIIDHQLLDDSVQKAQVNSCEIMTNHILNAIEKILKDNERNCVGIKLTIKPAFLPVENSAYFQQYRCHCKKDLAIVMSM